jgi:hypothetical protein
MPHTVPYIVDDALERSNEVDFSDYNLSQKTSRIGNATITLSLRLSAESLHQPTTDQKFWILKVHSNENIFLHLYLRWSHFHYCGPFPVRLNKDTHQEVPIPVAQHIDEFLSIKLIHEPW